MAAKAPTKDKPAAKPKGKNSEKTRTEIKYLYTDSERVELAIQQAKAAQRIEELEKEKTGVMEEFKAKIKEQEGHINVLANKVTSGYEYRTVDATVTYNQPKKGEKTYRDRDGKLLKTAKMVDADWQADLRLGNAKGVKKPDPKPEEEHSQDEKIIGINQAKAIAKGAKAKGRAAGKAAAKNKPAATSKEVLGAKGKDGPTSTAGKDQGNHDPSKF